MELGPVGGAVMEVSWRDQQTAPFSVVLRLLSGHPCGLGVAPRTSRISLSRELSPDLTPATLCPPSPHFPGKTFPVPRLFPQWKASRAFAAVRAVGHTSPCTFFEGGFRAAAAGQGGLRGRCPALFLRRQELRIGI